MTKLLASLVLLCTVAAACTSSDTTPTVPESATDQGTDVQDLADTTVSEPPEPEPADPDETAEPEPADPVDPDETDETTEPEPTEPDQTTEPEVAEPDETDETTEPEPTEPDQTTEPDEIDESAEPEPAELDETPEPEPAKPEPDETDETTEPEPTEPNQTTEPDETAEPDETVETPEPEPTEPDETPEPDETSEPDETTVDRLPADPEAPTGNWVAGINGAGWGFHRHLEGNAVSSPISIGTAFSLSRAGASADTGAVLDEIFGFPERGLHSAANAVDLRLAKASVEPTTLEVANRLFPDDGFSPRQEFLNTAAAQYGAEVQPIDTANGAAAADAVNGWVSERTRGLIPTIVDAGTVQDQQLVLVNTVYLKADWIEPFLPEFTEDGQFTTGSNQSVTVPFMNDRVPVERRYVRLEGADAVELPYQGDEFAMWLIVPHDPYGLAAVEESLDAAALAGLPRAAQKGTVQLAMPKWEQTLPPADLFEWLCPQGFCPGAPFEGIAPGIFISAALHGAKVIVDEEGTEAAASTAMAFPTSMPPPPDLTIVADRPFLWAIVHENTGALLFVGRLVNPAA